MFVLSDVGVFAHGHQFDPFLYMTTQGWVIPEECSTIFRFACMGDGLSVQLICAAFFIQRIVRIQKHRSGYVRNRSGNLWNCQ
jgi:hypothetical protein